MDTIWFLYTCVLLAVALVSCSLSLAVWMATRRRDCVAAAAGFAIYALELAFIFFDEYAGLKNDYPHNFDLPLTHPWESATLSVLFTASLWVWVLLRLRRPLTWRRALAPIAAYAVLAFALVPREGMSSSEQQWLYWVVRDLTVLGALLYALWRYRRTESEAERLDLLRSKRFFLVALTLVACMIVEDTVMILIYRPMGGGLFEAQFFWHLSERNISENMLMVACGIQLLRRNQRVLSMYVNHPPVGGIAATSPTPPAPAAPAAPAAPLALVPKLAIESFVAAAQPVESELETRMLLFADEHGLSARERDVLEQLLAGKDTQNIASALTISPGTVKAHLHRIYKKAEVSGREELTRAFWSS